MNITPLHMKVPKLVPCNNMYPTGKSVHHGKPNIWPDVMRKIMGATRENRSQRKR